MRRGRGPDVRAVAAWALAACLIVTGCTSKRGSQNKPTLLPVSTPDVSRLVNAPVREQVQRHYESLMAKAGNPASKASDLGSDYGKMGTLLMAAEYYGAAEPCFLNAESLVPDDMRWPYYLGRVYRQQGDAQKSAAAFERARALRPGDEATLIWLGKAYLDQGRVEAAGPLFEQALSANTQSAAALYGLGRIALAGQQYARAVEHLERAKSLDARASVVHYPLAMAYRGLGEAEKADAESRQRGDVEVGLADPLMDQAVESLETPAAYEARALRASNAGDWTTAAQELRKGVELAPENGDLRAKLGIALATSSAAADRAAAEEALRAALRLSPDRSPAHLQAQFHLAEVLRQSRRAQEALPHYEHVLQADPRMVEARFGYAMALVLLKRYPEARARLTEDAKQFPDRPEFTAALARLTDTPENTRVKTK